ncbi:hypothetical protein FCJ60_06830 [Burkholderia metallica]|nr:hypothetical protein [Burkholderia metallica]
MNGSAVSRQNGDGTVDRLAVRLTRRAPGSDDERSPYKSVRRRATGPSVFASTSSTRSRDGLCDMAY